MFAGVAARIAPRQAVFKQRVLMIDIERKMNLAVALNDTGLIN